MAKVVKYSERERVEVRARQNNARQSKLWVNLMRFHYWIILVRPKLISENPFEKTVKSLILDGIESINVEFEHSTIMCSSLKKQISYDASEYN